jgi:hypothetical protein
VKLASPRLHRAHARTRTARQRSPRCATWSPARSPPSVSTWRRAGRRLCRTPPRPSC